MNTGRPKATIVGWFQNSDSHCSVQSMLKIFATYKTLYTTFYIVCSKHAELSCLV